VSLRTAIEYVAAVYLLVWIAILVYMALIGQKVTRIEAELDRIEKALEERDA
jgi:CcmD family protein